MTLFPWIDFQTHFPDTNHFSVDEIAQKLCAGEYGIEIQDIAIRYLMENSTQFSSRASFIAAMKQKAFAATTTVYPTLAHAFAVRMFPFTFQDLVEIGNNPPDYLGCDIAHIMARNGHMFSLSEIAELRKPVDQRDFAIAHIMAAHGRVFSLAEIAELGNPVDSSGNTIAHRMASHGHVFSLAEIVELGNPVNQFGETIAHEMASHGHLFSIAELIELGNPANGYGATIAHFMAQHGHEFTPEEIAQLGNPLACYHNSISDDWKSWRRIAQNRVERRDINLIFLNGEPRFAYTDSNALTTHIEFTFGYCHENEVFIPENGFRIDLVATETGWKAVENHRTESYLRPDMEYYLVQSLAVSDLAVQITNCVKNGQTWSYLEWASLTEKHFLGKNVECSCARP